MKKILCVVLAVAMMLGLVACGGWEYGDYMSEELYNEYVSFYNDEWKDLASEVLAYEDNEAIQANEQAAAVVTAVRDREDTMAAIVKDKSFVPVFVEALEGEFTPEEMLENLKQMAGVLPDAIEELKAIAGE